MPTSRSAHIERDSGKPILHANGHQQGAQTQIPQSNDGSTDLNEDDEEDEEDKEE